MDKIISILNEYMTKLSLPHVRWIDIVEIIILSVFVYHFILWMKKTRAYTLIKGILVVILFFFVAYIFGMSTILWIAQRIIGFAITAILVIFQPELRNALEHLGDNIGDKSFVGRILPFDSGKDADERFSAKTIQDIIRASFDMGEVKTGALIVVEQNILLNEYTKTGISLDSLVSSQLLLNIFEHNTPLHDGAVIVRGNRIVAATCYLPLSDNLNLSKNLGTRHRAAVGISEVSDSLTIIVSEETGRVSTAFHGKIKTGVTQEQLREELFSIQKTVKVENKNKKLRFWKGKVKDEKKINR